MSDATVAVAAAAAAAAPAPALQTFEGQVVIIFGASRHLGRSLAVAFAARGAKLSLFARDADMLERTRQLALEAAGQSSAAIRRPLRGCSAQWATSRAHRTFRRQ